MTLLERDLKKIWNNDQINQQNQHQGNDRKEELALGDPSPIKSGFRLSHD
jgi:hypothetical protein